VLALWAGSDPSDRLATARELQERSESRTGPASDRDVVRGWLDLRRMDAALGRPPTDLRSPAALWVGEQLVSWLTTHAHNQGVLLDISITGPGFVYSPATPAGGGVNAGLTWPTLIGVASGTRTAADAAIEVSGTSDEVAAFSEALLGLSEAF